ncbi:MAG TPA: TetR/AcrR family transcriptional regulator [Solirubrobacteraceae bacterium]|nr:TetR/AcrR family transcriptional regulator [Solirubrobacteraceae bacterium]
MYVSSHTGSTYVKAEGTAQAPPSPKEAGGPAEARPRTKAAQREATTSALIGAARQLFAERGYAGVGTEEIVQLAGVTRGALYHHFKGGKEQLFRAVLVQLSAETVRQIAAAASVPDDPWEALNAGADAFLDACATPEVQRIMLVDGPSVLGWDVWRAIDTDHGLGLLEQALARAADAGATLPGSTTAVAHVLAGALDEAAMVVARAEDPAAAREEMGRTVRRLLEGLRGPAA